MSKADFISVLAHHIQEKYDLQKEELTIVFPNKRAAFYLRSKFKEIYHEDIWLPQMLSIEEAVTQWSRFSLVDSVDVLFELVAIGVFDNTAVQMAKDFDEIDQYGVDADHLFSFIFDDKKIGAWHFDHEITEAEDKYLHFFGSLKTNYDLLRKRLWEQHKGYYGMITRYLAGLSDEELLEKTGHKTVVFAGFNALTPTEQKIIRMLCRNNSAEVVWDFDSYYVDDPQNEAGLFARRYIEHDEPWKPVSFSNRLLTEAKEIHLVKVNGNTIQAKALQSLLQQDAHADASVILADENLLIPVLNAIPDVARYSALKVSMGYPMRLTSLNRFVTEFFTLRRKGRKVKGEGWYLWPILRILDLELVKVVFNAREIKELDQYKSFVHDKSVYIFRESDFDQYCQSEDLREFVRLLTRQIEPKQDVSESRACLELLTSVLVFLADKIQRTDVDHTLLFLLNQVSEVGKAVNRLKDLLTRYHDYANGLDELETLYRMVSANTSIKLKNNTTGGLQLMGLLEARNLDFDTFYMVGVNEGVLPADKSNGSLIPYYIRKQVGLPDYREKQAVYAYHFYRQLQGAEKVFLIYNANDVDAGGEPSRFLLQLKYELARKNPRIRLTEEVFSCQVEKTPVPERLTAHKTDEVMAMLMDKIQADDVRRALAPTSISAFIQCPLRFFLRHLMRIEDNSLEEDTQNNVIGSVVHDTLEKLYKDRCNLVVDRKVFSEVLRPSLEGYLQQSISKWFAQGLPDVGYNYLNQLTIKKMFDNYLRYEEAEVARHDLLVLDVEHTFHTALPVNGLECVLAGKADRVDRYDGITRIIDYKTGFVNDRDVKVPAQIDDIRTIPEKAMQLLIYKYLYLKEHPEVHPDTVTAAIFGLKNRQVCFPLKVEHQGLNDDFMTVMEAMLSGVYASMMDRAVPFSQPSDTVVKPCYFCDFKNICANTVAGASLANDR